MYKFIKTKGAIANMPLYIYIYLLLPSNREYVKPTHYCPISCPYIYLNDLESIARKTQSMF